MEYKEQTEEISEEAKAEKKDKKERFAVLISTLLSIIQLLT
jgi:hypothetical protein